MSVKKKISSGVLIILISAGLGIAAGYYAGIKIFPQTVDSIQEGSDKGLGYMVDLERFTVNLADPESHSVVVKMRVEVNATPLEVRQMADPGWTVIITDEVLRVLKDQRYRDLRRPESINTLQAELRTRLNAELPEINNAPAVRRVLFEEYIVR